MEIKQEDNYESDSYATLASNTFDFILDQIVAQLSDSAFPFLGLHIA